MKILIILFILAAVFTAIGILPMSKDEEDE